MKVYSDYIQHIGKGVIITGRNVLELSRILISAITMTLTFHMYQCFKILSMHLHYYYLQFLEEDTVRVISNLDEVKYLQRNHGGCNEDMAMVFQLPHDILKLECLIVI